jgi:ABC-type Fe3+/spermidine/putrescine transport system ATPase subunit
MAKRIDEVVAFAGLERFRDAKLKSLSSGMLMRLAFATALRADADILLLDEVLAVGDAEFQQKCFDVFDELKARGKTIVLVSHDLGSVQRFCHRVFWLDKGRLVMHGEAGHVVQTYLNLFRSHEIRQATGQDKLGWSDEEAPARMGDGRMRYVHGRLENEEGTPIFSVRSGERVTLRVTVDIHEAVEEPVFGFVVRQLGGLGGHTVYMTHTKLLEQPIGSFAAGVQAEVCFHFTGALMNGQYTVAVSCGDANGVLADWLNDFVTFSVYDSRCWEGVADLIAKIQCRTIASSVTEGDQPTGRSAT